jgi:uncharacterized protein YaiL (DUF2058 family)
MAKTLQDQLVSLGLAKTGPAKAKKKSRGSTSGARHKKPQKKGPGAEESISLEQAYRLKASEEKSSRERERARKRAADRLRRQINTQLRQIIDTHALNDASAEIKRNFLYKGRIRSVLVTPEQLKAVNSGEIGVIFLRGRYYLLPAEHIATVRSIAADHVPDLGGEEPDDEEFPVPDDLVW